MTHWFFTNFFVLFIAFREREEERDRETLICCSTYWCKHWFFFLKILFIYFQRKRRREISMCGCLSDTPAGDLAHNPGMCPDWESNHWPFGSKAALNPLSHTSQGLFLTLYLLLILLQISPSPPPPLCPCPQPLLPPPSGNHQTHWSLHPRTTLIC